PPRARTRRTPSSTRAATRSTATPRSTTSRTTSLTCEPAVNQPPIDPEHDSAYSGLLVTGPDPADHWAFGTSFEDPLAGVDTTVPDGVDARVLGSYALMLGDDALVLSHRLSEWCSNAPDLEEDIALANIALDLLGHARLLLARAAKADPALVPSL